MSLRSRCCISVLLCLIAFLPLSAWAEESGSQPEAAEAFQIAAAAQQVPAAKSDSRQKEDAAWHEHLAAQTESNLRQLWSWLLAAAKYPFFTFKEIRISVAALLKLAVLLALALLLLHVARGKAAVLLERKTRLAPGTAASVTTLGYYAAAVLVFLVILNTIGINLTQLTVVFGALGIGIGFGLQAIMNNFISGIILLAERAVRTGDIVDLGDDLSGEVKKIAIRSTVIRTSDGEDVIVPNAEFISGRVKSWTHSDDWRRLSVPFGVAYDADPHEVVRLAVEAARSVEITQEDAAHPVMVFFEGFGDSSLNFSLKVWCRMLQIRPGTGLRSGYYFALHSKLKAAGIEIPFPQRELRLRSASQAAAAALAAATRP